MRNAGPQQFVEAVTLRRGDYRKVAASLEPVPDAAPVEGEAPLAPTRGFGRALLGAIAPATAEQLKRLGPYTVGDHAGEW